ncbi:transcriptional regulator [Mangrovactinospora gilvigrisea]|uniref:Transcriptional regulator n=1 Tax=Mangrovactinospora gilvigrisea TaxID=1428644 RepID=A0A1J7BFN5_9ACTN|nr:helix-turn-helix transcriptional regulator [Mangrovactinospora gilvigrisea]OIV37462.1 transcriptional regulator [Mangrovactinospora gilvigrisea]
MPAPSSSSVQHARKALGARLRELREDARMTGRQFAALCGWSGAKVSRIESARTSPSPDDLRVWASVCGVPEQSADLIASLRNVTDMFTEWRRMERAGLKQAQQAQLPLFERTRRFKSYSSWLVPGMIQTEAYTRAVLRAVQKRRGLVDDVEAAVRTRMERQHILQDGGKVFAFLIEEAVLRSCLGNTDVMVGQLGSLITVSSLPNVSLGIVPMGVNRMRMPTEGFWIYDDHQVNVELVSGYLTITQQYEIELYAQAFAEFAESAEYGAAARARITAAINSFG